MSRITIELDNETMLKLARRSERVGMIPTDAIKEIATKGPDYFLARLVGATNLRARRASDPCARRRASSSIRKVKEVA